MPERRDPRIQSPAEEVEGGQRAAALRYDGEADAAPRLVAQGRGALADKILELARENGVPIRKDPTLVSILSALDVGAQIPPDLYGVIAEVLAWAYNTDRLAAIARDGRAAA